MWCTPMVMPLTEYTLPVLMRPQASCDHRALVDFKSPHQCPIMCIEQLETLI